MSTDQKSWIAYVGPIAFPEGDAGTRRVLGIAQSLVDASQRVVVAAALSPSSPVEEFKAKDGIASCGLGEYDRNWSGWKKISYLVLGGGTQTVRWLDRQAIPPKAVIVYGAPPPLMARMVRWCRTHGIPLIADMVEWYDGAHVVGGRFGPVHLSNEYAVRRLVPRCNGVIAISTFLERYYREKGLPVVRVPPTLDTRQMPHVRKADSGPIQLVYAGVPGKKDLIANAIMALARVDPNGEQFRLKLMGPDAATMARLFPDYPRKAVEPVGRKSHAEVIAQVAAADFTILLRPDRRYAHAGFPTKVAESLSCGTGVICNLTSDLAEHIRHGQTGIVCADHSVDAFVESLNTISKMPRGDIARMGECAREQACRAFDYRQYIEPLQQFLNGVVR